VLADLHLPAEFYLLKLSQKQVDLLRCAGLQAEPVDLPKGIPRTLEEALEFKPPDHDLENRSPAGSSAPAMRGIRFGTGSGRENARVYLADFFKAVDRGVRELVQGKATPLILAGVGEDTVIYQSISEYPRLLEDSIHGSASMPSPQDELLRQAYAIIRADCTERAAASLVEMKERMAPARFLTDLDAILRAAVEGRVGWLYINEDAQIFGVFEGVRRGGRLDWGEEDLLNVAALETLLQRGSVYALPDAKMPDGVAVAAGLRY